jgi:hypothetical protein
MSSFTLDTLPPEVLSNILTWFCDGKTISSFSVVAQCSLLLDLKFIQNALTYRFKYLARRWFQDDEEIRDVLEVLGEEIRTNDSSFEQHDNDMGKLSEYCAILDYFELQKDLGHYIVWSGSIATQFGIIQAEMKTTSHQWTPTSLQYWFNDFELYQFSLAAPVRTPTLPGLPYGSFASSASTRSIWKGLLYNLNTEMDVLGRYALVPRHLDFEANPTIIFSKRFEGNILNVYWDQVDGYDWEDGIEKLGVNVIRIMNRMGPSFPLSVQKHADDEESLPDDDEDDDESEASDSSQSDGES